MVRSRGRALSAALFASLLAVTGCQARVGTNYGAPNLPVTVPAQANPQTPTPPAVIPTGEATTVAGQARLAGAPMANASLKVENALTGAPMTLFLTDGREVAGGDPSLTTDAEGRFSMRVMNVTADQVLRVIATSGDKTLTALVSGDGLNLSGYGVLDTTFLVNVDEVSRAIDLVATGPLTLIAKTLKSSVGAEVRKALLADLKAATTKLVEAARTNGSLATLLNGFSTLKTAEEQAAAVKEALEAANLTTEVNTLVATTMQSTALKAQQAANLVEGYSTDAFQNIQLVGTSFKVNLGANNSLQIVNTTTGTAISVTGTSTPASSGGSGGGGSSTPVVTFRPNETITFDDATDELTVVVTQVDGHEDIGKIVARIAKDKVTLDATALADTTQFLTFAGASSTTVDSTLRPLSLVRDPAAPTTVDVAAVFSSVPNLTSAVWSGHLTDTGTSTQLATFQILDGTTHWYLVTEYLLGDAVTVNGGHTTTLRAGNVITAITADATADVAFVSRKSPTPTQVIDTAIAID